MWPFKKVEEEVTEQEEIVQENTGFKNFFGEKKQDKKSESSAVKYIYFQPESLNDSKVILELLKNNVIVTFNLQNLDEELRQRFVDIVYGQSHALDGRLVEINTLVYTSLPECVKVVNFEYEESSK